MGTEILRPQDCLTERLRVNPVVFPRRKCNYGNPRINRKPAVRSDRSDRNRRFGGQSEPSISKRSNSDDLRSTKKNDGFVMGQVTILRRGESLDSKLDAKIKAEVFKKDGDDLMVIGTQRLGPDPEMVPKQVRIKDLTAFLSPVAVRSDVYAGSAFSNSPSPSSLPLPSFWKKKSASPVVEDSATRDLRRLLRLD